MRTPGEGEQLVAGLTREAFDELLRGVSRGIDEPALDEYWRGVEGEGREAVLELYRSGNLEELQPYVGGLAALGVPTLLLWGEDDPFAPVAGAHRLAREIPHAQLRVIAGTGHFVVEDAPDEYARSVADFLA
jgi:haloalkane dehalogenase